MTWRRRSYVNAKLRRTGVCGATETLLVDKAAPAGHLAALVGALADAGCEVSGDAAAQAADNRVLAASEQDWSTEYLDAIIAVRVIDGVEGAIAHIRSYGSQHTDCIVANDSAAAERFLAGLDSAIVLHNASTQFADGGEIRHGRGNRHRHRAPACPRAGRRRAADHVQIRGSRHRSNPTLTAPAAGGTRGARAPSHTSRAPRKPQARLMRPTTNSTMMAPIAACTMGPRMPPSGQKLGNSQPATKAPIMPSDDVADQAEASPVITTAGEPTGDGANNQKDDECLRIHAFAPRCGRTGQSPPFPCCQIPRT